MKQEAMISIAAQAPETIPAWFVHTPPAQPIFPKTDGLNEDEKKIVYDWFRDPIYDLPDELHWYQDAVQHYNIAFNNWLCANERERYFQWRVYFATYIVLFFNDTKTS